MVFSASPVQLTNVCDVHAVMNIIKCLYEKD